MSNKQQHGQFFTKNSDYIISDLAAELKELIKSDNEVPEIVDPFAGDCDLLSQFDGMGIGLDIDPQSDFVIENDSLLNPIDYSGKWIVTNPPWLAKNKNKNKLNKKAYDKYNTNDLYKCAMLSFKNSLGGIIIVPLNFWCEEHKSIRTEFLNNFAVSKVKVFEEQIFKDTTYTACAFLFIKKNSTETKQSILFEFWRGAKFTDSGFVPGQKYLEKTWALDKKTDYIIGNDYVEFVESAKSIPISVGRFTKHDSSIWNNMVLYAQDTGTEKGKIKLKVEEKTHIDKSENMTDRVFAGIKINNYSGKKLKLSLEQQEQVCRLFNAKLEEFRNQYNSMNLTNYRNSTSTMARKRISFDSAYAIIKWATNQVLSISV